MKPEDIPNTFPFTAWDWDPDRNCPVPVNVVRYDLAASDCTIKTFFVMPPGKRAYRCIIDFLHATEMDAFCDHLDGLESTLDNIHAAMEGLRDEMQATENERQALLTLMTVKGYRLPQS